MTEIVTSGPTRRQVLLTTGAVAAAAVVTSACGGPSASGTPTTGPLATTADVPVGGGTINVDQKVVVTQPTAGVFKAFTAVCTHQGCTVASVADGVITCPCHNSLFSATDGSVQGGPAPAPLAPVAITVSGTTISRA
jgi:Rieske Fe-S protein